MKLIINGNEFSAENASTVYEAAKEAELISRAVIAAKVNGEVCALSTAVNEGDTIELLTFAEAEGKQVFRHTAAHILAQAVKRLFPETKLTIGPAVENGFYYDFDSETPFTPEVLKKLEDEMKKIVKENLLIERFELPRAEAIAFMEEKNEPYKVQLINELPEDATISFYRQGEFVDLCAGPHLFSTGAVKAIKLMQCTGAYWRATRITSSCSEYTVRLIRARTSLTHILPSLKRHASATTTKSAASLNSLPRSTLSVKACRYCSRRAPA